MGFDPVQKMCKDSVAWLACRARALPNLCSRAKRFVLNFNLCRFPPLTAKAGKPRTEKWILRKASFRE